MALLLRSLIKLKEVSKFPFRKRGKTMGIKFKKGENYNISKYAIVKTTRYNNGTIKIRYTNNTSSNLSNYQKLNKYEYLDKKTGEILEYNKSEIKSKENIKRTMNNKVRPILENNFWGGNNELFVSLTFSNDMQDFNELPKYFDNFWKRLTRKYKNTFDLACVYVKEMQMKRNCWHYHVMLKEVNKNNLYIDCTDLYRIWKYGNITVSRIWSGNAYSYKRINEEKRMEDEFFLSKKTIILKMLLIICAN